MPHDVLDPVVEFAQPFAVVGGVAFEARVFVVERAPRDVGVVQFEPRRVQVTLGAPMTGLFAEAEDLAIAIDECIVGGLRIFPTNVEAARLTGLDAADSALEPLEDVMAAFHEHIDATPEPERRFLLDQYANPIRNQQST